MHQSVLLKEVLEIFQSIKIHTFIDGTLGAGGHAEAILEAHPEITYYLGIDQDSDALQIAEKRLEKWKDKVRLQKGNFSDLLKLMELQGLKHVDGILLDLGVSSMQLDQGERGFSLKRNGPLDMRMDREQPLDAQQIVNHWSENDLGRIFRDYGEERRWRAAARGIVQARTKAPIETTHQLVEALRPPLGYPRRGEIDPTTLVFQALRLAVNQELERVEEVIPDAISALQKGGRLGIISFHSLEDRIVKQQFRYRADDKEGTSGFGGVFISKEPEVKLLYRKAIAPSDDEVSSNPRSRSAKLRAVEKL